MDLLKVFIWKEAEVFRKVAEAIGAEPSIIDIENYAYWDRNSPIIIQAHIDVVTGGFKGQEWNKDLQKMVKIKDIKQNDKELLRCRNIITSKIGVLGGDDRAGVATIIAVNNSCKSSKIPLPSILLTNGEESGGTGMKELIKVIDEDVFKNVRIIIGLDRRGCSEYVTYFDSEEEVRNYIESFGFVKGFGSYSDSKDFSRHFRIPHVNLSVGYYDNHSSREVVHIDEMLLTAKRVSGMLKDPISKRYAIESEKTYVYRNVYSSGNISSNLKFSDLDKRRTRCEKLRIEYALPYLCTNYPYLDYLLSNEDILDGYHVVTRAEGSRVLEEWALLFNAKEDNKISNVWKKEYGKSKKIYIKTAGTGNKFYLAILFDKNSNLVARSSTSCEMQEENIIKNENERIKRESLKTKGSEKEIEVKVVSTIDESATLASLLEQQYGYCGKWSAGECDGGCHGNRYYCHDPEIGKYGDYESRSGWF